MLVLFSLKHFWRFLGKVGKLDGVKHETAGALVTIYMHMAEMQAELVKSLDRQLKQEAANRHEIETIT